MKRKVAEVGVAAVTHIKAPCAGLLVDSQNTIDGNTNTGPLPSDFFMLAIEGLFQVS